MIIIYLRASTFNAFDYCSHKYFIQYVLGLKELSGKSADIGTITHKYLEILALKKLAEQNGEEFVEDEDLPEKKMRTADITLDSIRQFVYDKITSELSHHEWTDKDYALTVKYANYAMNFRGGIYNPLTSNIVDVEHKFDFVLEKPEFKYKYEIDGKQIEGYLGIRGTMDLVVAHENNVIEIIDYKTGARKDWAKNKTKEVRDLYEDFQLLLYYYVIKRKFPDKHILTTIYYLKGDGPYTMDFDETAIEKTEKMIKNRFDEIRQCNLPQWIKGDFRCKFCQFSKINPEISSNTNVCDFFRRELIRSGIQTVTEKYMQKDALTHYSGGGKR